MPGPKPPGLVSMVALAIAQGQSTAAIAKKHGLSTRAIQQWMKRPAFAAKVESLRSQMLDEAVGIMAAGATTAAAQLQRLASKGKSESIRLAASRALLADLMAAEDHAKLARELREIKARLDSAERKGKAHGQRPR